MESPIIAGLGISPSSAKYYFLPSALLAHWYRQL
ncbi:unnamed protein product [Penicillium roqueforti FM164]|uniref:Genomic scaffold, ProqFM164S01 n=1 Tax=Penicillium roqueforti (strain FM164) TaxID=1365484 RepID=W6QJ58_PENRF|nr:unnamed protein product [Penicillium roqueforti FM164]